MLRIYFYRALMELIDSIAITPSLLPTGEDTETLNTFREVAGKQLADYDERMPDDSYFLDDPKARRLYDAKRSVYLAVIELIDAKITAITP